MRSILLSPVLESALEMWAVILKATTKVLSRGWEQSKLKHHNALCSYRDITIFFRIKHSTGCCKLLVRFQISENVDSDSFCQDFCCFYRRMDF